METLTIGELARRGEVHLETIRYYEREGVMRPPSRKPSGHRAYARTAVRWLRFIKRAQELGFSLAEIKELLSLKVNADHICTDAAKSIETSFLKSKKRFAIFRQSEGRSGA